MSTTNDGDQQLEQHLADLNSTEIERRYAAVAALGASGDPRAYEPLAKLAQNRDEPYNLQRACAAALKTLRAALPPEQLIALLSHNDLTLRRGAASMLALWNAPSPYKPVLHDWQRYNLSALVDALNDPDAAVRRDVVRILGLLSDAQDRPVIAFETFAPLAEHDPDPKVRRSALYAYGDVSDLRLVELIAKLLRDPDPMVRGAAGGRLAYIADDSWDNKGIREALGAEGRAQLIANLRDPDLTVRRGALAALWWLHIPESIEPLIAALQDEDAHIRGRAASALRLFNDRRALAPLTALLNDPDEKVRYEAAHALTYLPHTPMQTLLTLLASGNARTQVEIVRCLGKRGDTLAIAPLAALLEQPLEDKTALAVVCALIELGDPRGLEALFAGLQTRGKSFPAAGASILAYLADPRGTAKTPRMLLSIPRGMTRKTWGQLSIDEVIEPLIKLLANENASVHNAAANALGRLGDARAVEPLIKLLNERQSVEAAEALGHIGDSRAVEPLLTMLQTFSGYGRKDIIAAWGRLAQRGYADPRAFELILQMVNDADIQVRREALRVLGYFGDARAIPALRAALGERPDTYNLTRDDAARGLGRLGDTETRDVLLTMLQDQTGDPTTRTQAARWLGLFGDPAAVLPLIGVLNETNAVLRLQAIEALGWLKDAPAVEPLLALLHDPDPAVRYHAAETLGIIGDIRAVKALIALLDDDTRLPYRAPVRRVWDGAYIGLKTIATPEALAAVEAWRAREAGNSENGD